MNKTAFKTAIVVVLAIALLTGQALAGPGGGGRGRGPGQGWGIGRGMPAAPQQWEPTMPNWQDQQGPGPQIEIGRAHV